MNDTGTPTERSASAAIRLIILDDHEMVVEGLAAAFGATEGIEVTGVSTTIESAVEQAKATAPQVALVDYRLADGDTGSDAIRAIHAVSSDTAVVVITAHHSPEIVAAAIEAGCAGFLPKNESLQKLIVGVRAAANGEALFSPEMLAGLRMKLQKPEPAPHTSLSGRELEVLVQLAQGRTTADIADTLFISRNTARNHIQNILMKLDAHSRLEAVAIALRLGIVPPGDSPPDSPGV